MKRSCKSYLPKAQGGRSMFNSQVNRYGPVATENDFEQPAVLDPTMTFGNVMEANINSFPEVYNPFRFDLSFKKPLNTQGPNDYSRDPNFTGPVVPDYAKDFTGVEERDSFAKRAFDFLPSGQNILLGAGVANSLLTRRQDYDRFRRNYREPGQEMSRGDWTTNQGILKPDRLGYFDKFSIGTGSMKMGGEVEMTDDEIYEFLAAGGELEFID